ncbi:seven-hairpin glycosidase [Microthyrium microscopicum]|uniref:alpha-1,2-Mannosidase n=1 Tax=Microthyrium microscopicum TaxID=703497 RepID=A0A6A6UN14_9PEZI|nr:seven-hairpin glycosidase [Microthyrium microscopicum]
MRYRRRSNPIATSKIVCAIFVVTFYLFYAQLHPPARTQGKPLPKRQAIQYERWNKTGKADLDKRLKVKQAMIHTYKGYREKAWGKDDIKPVSGKFNNSRNGWGAFIVDSTTTLAVMGMWEELTEELNFITKEINFQTPEGLVDPFETTIRYLGGMVSVIELGDNGLIPSSLFTTRIRKGILMQAEALATNLLVAFDPRTGLPYPRIDFRNFKVSPMDATVGPARIGSNFLEMCTLSRLTGDPEYCSKATIAWSSLVRNKYVEDLPGLVDGKINVETGELLGRNRHWDAGHDSYYEYLLKASLLFPSSPNSKVYRNRWTQAAEAVRHNITSRSSPYQKDATSHLYMGKWNGPWYLNEMSHLACFAPGNLLLGGRVLRRKDLVTLGKALLDGCRHTYATSPLGIGPEKFSWLPSPGSHNGTFEPKTDRQKNELAKFGFWVADARFQLRPEYVESLFYAFRTTGEQRYRDWAWEAFEAMEKYCKTEFGYAGIEDVMVKEGIKLIDDTESFWAAETLKYLYLIFDDVNVMSLDDWIFSTEGHLFRGR